MNRISKAHGTGGSTARELIDAVFNRRFAAVGLRPTPNDDAAHFLTSHPELIVTTDSHVIDPIEFPGGNIGKLAICGVVNDLLTRAGKPLYLSAGFILEEGLEISVLERVIDSMAITMKSCGIELLCADTKVIPARSPKPGMMMSTTLIGEPIRPGFHFRGPKPGDQLIVTGPFGSHGLAILQAREKLPFRTVIESDCAPLIDLLMPVFRDSALKAISYMRDPTRGGISGILHELAHQFEVSFELEEFENGIGPVLPQVRAGLEILGMDPLDIPNEGIMLLIVDKDEVRSVLSKIRNHILGQHAAILGTVTPKSTSPLTLRTQLGGHRIVNWSEGLNLPRIC